MTRFQGHLKWDRQVLPDERIRARRSRVFMAIGLGFMTAALAFYGAGDWCVWSPDGFWYLTHARALAETGAFPPRRMIAPPGMPALFAPLLLYFGDLPLLSIRVLNAGCWAVVAAFTFMLHRRGLGNGLALAAGFLIATSTVMAHFAATPLSEPVFTALSLMVLLQIDRWHRRGQSQWWELCTAGVLLSAAIMVRSIGLVLLPIAVWALLRGIFSSRMIRFKGGLSPLRGFIFHHDDDQGLAPLATSCRPFGAARWSRAILFLAVVVGPLVAWELRQSHYAQINGYGRAWVQARSPELTRAVGWRLQLERLFKFGPRRLEAVKEAVVSKQICWRLFNSPLDAPTTWLIGGVIVLIAVYRWFRQRDPRDAYVVLTLFALALWPYDEGVRLVVPLMPILVAYPLWLGREVWRWSGDRRFPRAVLIGALFCWLNCQIAGMGVWLSRLPALRDKNIGLVRTMSGIADWHRQHIADGARTLGVTLPGDNDKLVLAGAAYLSRRAIEPIDMAEDGPFDISWEDAQWALVQRSLEPKAREYWGLSSCEYVNDFAVFRKQRLVPTN